MVQHVNALLAGMDGSAWMGRDPDMQAHFLGPETGVGATMEWASDDPAVRNGRQRIIESTKNEGVSTKLDPGDMGPAAARFDLVPEGDTMTVTRGLEAQGRQSST